MVDAAELQRVAGTEHHGGVVAVARPHPVRDFDPEAAKAWSAAGAPLLALDGIGNPHNLGAIARTAAFFGLERLVISDHAAQAGPSDAAYRIAEGGLDQLELYRATRFATTLKRLKPGYRVVGTALGSGRPVARLAGDRPVALILGNEEEGLGAATLAACDEVVTIPGSGRVQSLNVSAAAAILIHELTRGRR
jgi:TrmH RNA methyltransferase